MEERGIEFTGQALVSGGLSPASSTGIIHGLASRYTFGRISAYGAGIVFVVLGITMIHCRRAVQFGALGVAVTLHVTQSCVGRSPFTMLRAIGAGVDGRFR